MSNNIAVSITADVADLQVKRAVMSAELKAATKDLNAFAKEAATSGSTEALREGMLASATAAEKAKASIAQVNAELKAMSTTAAPAAEHVEHGLAGIAASAREMGVQLHESVAGLREIRESLISFGELMMAAFAVEEIHRFAEAMGEAAEKTYHVAQQLGLTMAQTQGLAAAAAATGIPFDALTKGMGQMDLRLEKNPKLFRDLGILIPQNATQMQVLNAVMDRFNGMADGPNKTAIAMALMGRAGKELIPFLNEGSAGFAELIEKAKEYGAVNEEAAGKGVKLAESLNEGKLAMLGLKMTLSDAFAPLLTELVDGFNGMVKAMTESYNTGGALKVVFDAIGEAFHAVGDILGAVGAAFSVMFSGTGSGAVDWAAVIKTVIDIVVMLFKVVIAAVVTLVEGFKIGFDEMIGQVIDWYGRIATTFEQVGEVIDIMKVEFQMLGRIVEDSLSLRWGSIAADWDAGLAQIDNVVRTRGKQIADDARAYAQQAQGWFASADGERDKLAQYWAHAGDTAAPPKSTGIKLPKHGEDPGGDLSTAGDKGKHHKAKDELVQQLEAALTAKKLAWAAEQDARGTAIAFSLQVEADYWSKILQRTNLSAKDRAAIETKYLAVHSQIIREKWAIEEDGYKRSLAEADKNEAAKLLLAQKHLDVVGHMFGLESKEYAAAQAEIVRIKRDAAQQIVELERIRQEASDRANLAEITAAENLAKQRVALGVETNAQLLAQDRQFEERRFQIELQAAQRNLKAVDPSKDPVKYAQLARQIETLEQQHQLKLTQIDQQAALQRTAIQRTAIASTAQLWSSNIAKLITLQQGFSATLKGLYQGMVQIVSNALATILEQWLVKHISTLLLGRAASSAAAVAQVTSAIGLAGANGVASFAAAPWPIDMGAPAFGASMAAAAAAFAPAASAAGGWWDVPTDTPTMIHAREMVLPAWAAQPLRTMLGGGAANNNSPAAANDGGEHYHLHFNGPTDKASIEKWLMTHQHGVAKAAKAAARNGAKVN